MKTLRLFLTVLSCIALLLETVSAYAQNTISDTTDGFALTLPKRWRLATVPGFKFTVAITTPTQNFAPNINVVDEEFKGSIFEYAKWSRKSMTRVFPDDKVVSHTTFQTKSGVHVERYISEHKGNGTLLRFLQYYLPSKRGKMLVITLTDRTTQGSIFDKEIDEAVRQIDIH